MYAYYNEFDPFAAEWLRQLIKKRLIPDGVVDDRDMNQVNPAELKEFQQHHFFAGIGGWAYALRLAGWPDDKPVMTGSPPCQPFSAAGKQKGVQDERHLAPRFLKFVKEIRPPVVFGEQVATAVTKDGWLDSLQDELERNNYTTGAIVIPACGVGAPHIRQRLWFVAYDSGQRRQRQIQGRSPRSVRPWGESCKEIMQQIFTDPKSKGSCYPQPLLCGMDDGFSGAVYALRGYGNAIVPQVAAEIISAYLEYEKEKK